MEQWNEAAVSKRSRRKSTLKRSSRRRMWRSIDDHHPSFRGIMEIAFNKPGSVSLDRAFTYSMCSIVLYSACY